ASKTAKAVKSVEGTKAKITDTRKTTPGVRALEKYAIRVGGGTNHRFNLASGVLIKDNHIAVSGGIKKAVENARKMIPHTLKIEVEVETIEQLMEALEAKADIIMLDNMPNEMMSECVKIASGRAIIEASGNMGEKDLKEVAATGVDIISIGALTHSVKAADISLKFKIS
ncbi:MAG: carboxylating nicotinate-nucleotide diphosphorylase, partial [Clostridia bacterium]|nr:carboxylating nicotinate-nucleotide diphosphorylase [Clostridia bacterium]